MLPRHYLELSYSNLFAQLVFSDVFGSSNRAAKVLAGYAKVNKEPSTWLEEGPALSFQLFLRSYLNFNLLFSFKKKIKN
jgi:hypothetical protein